MISNKSILCVGCGACASICPKKCIKIENDNEGFQYPLIDTDKCINCNLCDSVCLAIQIVEPTKVLSAYAGYSKNEDRRFNSSSGGIFYELAKHIIENGGTVFGAEFDSEWAVKHTKCTSLDGIKKLQKSKYVQSDTTGIFTQVQDELKKGIPVLFSGTPCQCNALSLFLNNNYENLLTVDFICHGVPSPLVWKKYLDTLGEIKQIDFRDKSISWLNYNFTVTKPNGTESEPYHKNPYMNLFLSDFILRPSCYNCKSKFPNKASDITIGDLWGANSFCPDLDDDKGLSLITVNSHKGEKYIEKTLNGCFLKSINAEDAFKNNLCAVKSVKMPKNRDYVMNSICYQKNPDFDLLAKKYATKNIFSRAFTLLYNLSSKTIRSIKNTQRQKSTFPSPSAIVTGCTGSVGVALINKLVDEGYTVYAVLNPSSLRNSNVPENEKVKKVFCAIDEYASLPERIDGKCDMFFHLAWAGTFGEGRNDAELQQKNVKYALDAVKAAKALGCEVFVGVGSQAEYGRVAEKLCGNTPANPESEYGKAKLIASQRTKELCNELGIRHEWVRLLSVYGPYDNENSLVYSAVSNLKKGINPTYTKGEQVWDLLYCDDAANALYLIAKNGRQNEIYVVGSGEEKPLKEYIKQIYSVIAPDIEPVFGQRDYAENQVMYLCADIEKLKNDTGFCQKIPFEEGIKRMAKEIK